MSNVQNLTEEINELQAQFTLGVLSASEYEELLEDIKSTKVIQAAADDLALQTQLNQLINGLITASKLI